MNILEALAELAKVSETPGTAIGITRKCWDDGTGDNPVYVIEGTLYQHGGDTPYYATWSDINANDWELQPPLSTEDPAPQDEPVPA